MKHVMEGNNEPRESQRPETGRCRRRRALGLAASLLAIASSGLPASSNPAADLATSIDNGKVRVTLTVWPSREQWRLWMEARTEARWVETATLGIHGVFSTEALQKQHSKQFKTSTPMQGAMPREVLQTRTDAGQELAFRLARDEVWMDIRIGLPGDSALVVLQCPAVSHPELLPQTSVRFTERVFSLVADADGTPLRRREWLARDHRDGVHVYCERYMAAWGPATVVVPMVLWWPVGQGPRRAHWPRGGLDTVYLPMPYLLAFDAEPFERTVHTVQHRAVGFAGLAGALVGGN